LATSAEAWVRAACLSAGTAAAVTAACSTAWTVSVLVRSVCFGYVVCQGLEHGRLGVCGRDAGAYEGGPGDGEDVGDLDGLGLEGDRRGLGCRVTAQGLLDRVEDG